MTQEDRDATLVGIWETLTELLKVNMKILDELKETNIYNRNYAARSIHMYMEARNRIGCTCKSPFGTTAGCPVHGVKST